MACRKTSPVHINTESGCKDSKAELFDCSVANVTSKVTHTSMLVCMVLTISFCSLVWFHLDHLGMDH